MHLAIGLALIAASTTLVLATAFRLRSRVPRAAADALAAVAGAGLGLGALALQHHVRTPEWIFAPTVLAVAAVLHIRVLFGGDGPLRT